MDCSTEQEIEKLLKQKGSENKRRLTKIAKELFHEKAFRSRKTRMTQMLKLFAVILFKHLRIKISDKSLTQRFDVSMTSLSSEKIKYR